MAAALVTSLSLRPFISEDSARGFALNLILTTLVTTVVWLAVTLLTKPEPHDTLVAFYRRVLPAGAGWRRFAEETGLRAPAGEIGRNALCWLSGVILVYSIMFATGALLFHQTQKLIVFGIALVGSSAALWALLARERRLDSARSRA